MRRLEVFISLLALSVCCPNHSSAQSSNLCVGAYYTEAEGALKLKELGARIHSLADWEAHADSVRNQVKAGLQLERLPKRPHTVVVPRKKKVLNGYSVEAVAFESLPGFYVTGNLYRPTNYPVGKSLAVIASPHGHWTEPEDYGRFRDETQIRCAALAKMGAFVFSYDMVGFGESQQLEHTDEKAALFQTLNTIRIIDYLLSMRGADSNRVAVTGESGGGTQTFLATALDDRISVSVPVVMVSSHFFGGCSCESGMPIHRTGDKVFSNVEIACLAAPRPMLFVSDGDDWTKHNPTVELPFAKQIYSLYDQESRVENAHFQNEKHDYGKNKRAAVYAFMAKHLGLDLSAIVNKQGTIDESFVTIQKRKNLEYFTSDEFSAHDNKDKVYTSLKNSY